MSVCVFLTTYVALTTLLITITFVQCDQSRQMSNISEPTARYDARNLRRNKFVQCIIGVELWRQNASHKLFRTLNHYGVTQGVDAARGQAARLGASHDLLVRKWKGNYEVLH